MITNQRIEDNDRKYFNLLLVALVIAILVIVACAIGTSGSKPDKHYTCFQNGNVIFDRVVTTDPILGHLRDKKTGKVISIPSKYVACTYTIETGGAK